MPIRIVPAFVRRCLGVAGLAFLLGGCAGFGPRDPVRAHVVGLEPLRGEGLEMRFDVKLRLQNPNEEPIEFDGLALELEVGGKPFATGVSDRKGNVPRYGETLLTVPVSVSAVAAVRQAVRLVDPRGPEVVPYELRGKLGGPLGPRRFSDRGTLDLPGFVWGAE